MTTSMNTPTKGLETESAEDRARIVLSNLKAHLQSAKKALDIETGPTIGLKLAFLQAFDHIISESLKNLEKGAKFHEFSLWNITKLIDELSIFPEFQGYVDELWDITVQWIIQEIKKQNHGDWEDESDSLMSAFSVVRELAEAGWKNPRLHQRTLELINDPIFYGLQWDSNVVIALFPSEKNSESLGTLVRKNFSRALTFISKWSEEKQKDRLAPTREDLEKRRIDVVFIAAAGFARSENRNGALGLFEECFRLLQISTGNRELYFYQKIDEIGDILGSDPELFVLFESKIRKFQDQEWRSYGLLSLARIHFRAFKDPKKVVELLDGLKGIKHIDLTRLIASVRDFVISANPLIDPKDEEIIQRLADILENSFDQSNNTEGMLEISEILNAKWNKKIAKTIQDRVAKRVGTMKNADDRFSVLLRLAKSRSDSTGTEWLLGEMEEFVDQNLGTIYRNGYEVFGTAQILANHYAIEWNMDAVDSLVRRTNENEEFPDDHVTEILEGAISGFIRSGDFHSAFECVKKTPRGSQGSNLNHMVRSLSIAGKFQEALEFASKRKKFRDTNVIAEESSDLVAGIMMDASECDEIAVVRQCLNLLLQCPLNEYVLRDIVAIYRTRRELFDSDYFSKLFPHATKSYRSWVSTSYFKAVLEAFREIDGSDLIPNHTTEIIHSVQNAENRLLEPQ